MTDHPVPTLADCLSFADVRERYGLSQRALRILVLANGLPRYRRLGDNRLYLRIADVERALAAKKDGGQAGDNVAVR
jgi:hypothetical protein